MSKYIAEITYDENDYVFLKPVMMLGEKKLENFDADKFGSSKNIKLNIDDKIHLFDYNAVYTFEIDDEDLFEENEKVLLNNCNSTTGKFYGKRLNIQRTRRDDKNIKLKTLEKDKTFAEICFVKPEIIENICNFVKSIKLPHKPLTNTIYLTDEDSVIGPFSFDKADEEGNYALFSYNSTEYYVDEYGYEDFSKYCSDISLNSIQYTLIDTEIINDNVKLKNSKKDCIPIDILLNLAIKYSGNELNNKSLDSIENLDKARIDRLQDILLKKENTDNNINELKIKLSKDAKIIELVLSDNKDSSDNRKNDELQDQINQKERELKDLQEENKTLKNSQSQSENYTTIIQNLQKELEDLNQYKHSKEELQELEKKRDYLIEEKGRKEQALITLKDNILADFEQKLKSKYKDVYDAAFSTSFESSFLSKILKLASEDQERLSNDEIIVNKYEEFNSKQKRFETPKELITFIYDEFKKKGRKYSKNDIANILICISQGFLSIFAGEPGTGKTSFVKYLAQFLGLNNSDINRYVEVSVEKGWSSKKDLLGYYNPLTKEMNVNNPNLYKGLRLLNKEALQNITDFPFFVLLDEANLSPMEYYWADFMKICDYNNVEHCKIDISENITLEIPRSLRFLATINLDHTTEILSPRLIDRCWIIKLPVENYTLDDNYSFACEEKDNSLVCNNIFEEINNIDTDDSLKSFVTNKFNKIQELFSTIHVTFSPRILQMIKKYCLVADKLELMETNGNELIALDYAVSQKILPMINGQGDKYKELVESLILLTDKMPICCKILNDIKQNAEMNGMEYYSFFAR